MSKNTIIAISVIAALAAITIPILVAINESWEQSTESEMGHMLSYAHDVVSRSDATADQVANGIAKLEQLGGNDPCSGKNLAMMQDIDISSTYIQAIGYVSEGRMICSSLGGHLDGLSLGHVDIVTPKGVAIRNNVEFAFAPNVKFLVLEYHHYAAIIHKDLPIDTTTREKDVSLATFMLGDHSILSSRGFVDPNWINALGSKDEIAFSKGGYIVALVKSKRHLIGTLAALPNTYLTERVRDVALMLVPIGILAGLALSAVVFYFARRQMSMPTALKAALKRNELFLEYQPIFDLQSGKFVGAEALIRWRMANGTLVPPDIFIPVAEQFGLIQQITGRVIELIEQDADDIFKKYPHFHIAVNLSPADLHSPRIVDVLSNLLLVTSGTPVSIIAEITERGFLKAGLAKGVLNKIRISGIGVAIDDFGTGYSSLSYLETFELDYLKIDKSFVDSIGLDAATSNVVHHIIEMAKSLNLKMIAEGVETEVQAKYLREHGVQFVQGWLFGKPMPFSQIIRKLSAEAHVIPL